MQKRKTEKDYMTKTQIRNRNGVKRFSLKMIASGFPIKCFLVKDELLDKYLKYIPPIVKISYSEQRIVWYKGMVFISQPRGWGRDSEENVD